MFLKEILKNLRLSVFGVENILPGVSFRKNAAYLALLCISVFIFFTNYSAGTWLIGWDSLHPELNYSTNFFRTIYSVWQEYRGLGLWDGMAHAANLPHTTFIWLLDLFMPSYLVRYVFLVLMHFLGGLGVYALVKNIVVRRHVAKEYIAFLAALFYLFNIATIQMFFAPFEVFAVHFAFLPWLLYTAIQFLATGFRRHFLLFLLFSVVSLPQAFVPTVFITYFVYLGLILFFSLVNFGRERLKRVILVALGVLLINSIWLLPYSFGFSANSQTIIEAKINQMSSEEVYLKNKARGNLIDVLLLRGSMLDVLETNEAGQSVYIMNIWREHANTTLFISVGTVFCFIAFIGLLKSIFKKRKVLYPIVLMFMVSLAMLASDLPLFTELNSSIRDLAPVFTEAFRFSFTKFSTVFALSYSVLFAVGIAAILQFVREDVRRIIFTKEIFVFFLILLTFYSYPIFTGQFFYDSLQLHTPKEYTSVINFFNRQEEKERVATFPQNTFWSWRFNDWGYRGSGFLWQAINQPSLDRAFDPWSRQNENYYWEISYALYSGSKELFENVLEKYQVQWLLIDESVINPSSSKSTYLDELYAMLLQSNKVELAQEFGPPAGGLKVYKVNLETPVKDFVSVLDNPAVVEPSYKWGNYDEGYGGYGGVEGKGYISIPKTEYRRLNTQYYYPFRSLFTGKRQEDLEFEVEEKNDHFVFRSGGSGPPSPEGFGEARGVEGEGHLEVSRNWRDDLVWIDPDDFGNVSYKDPEVYFDGKTVEVRIPKVGGLFSARIDGARLQDEQKSIYLPNLPHKLSYLITVESQNIKGRPFLFWLENLNSRKSDIETYLPSNSRLVTRNSIFIQPPMEEDGLGYTLHFDNVSPGSQKSVNSLGEVNVDPIPYKFLTGLVVRSEGDGGLGGDGGVAGRREVLVLSQSFNKGWVALTWDGLLPKLAGEHVLVNNWANGWVLRSGGVGGRGGPPAGGEGERIKIVFWPQVLEYIGFLLGLGFLILVWRRKI